ncbi:hypothetical protein TNCV_3580311 [Trichonephila clavipes]|nr:hypothetical protein TNCV_3580311 [Trichonephila clavipes]
MVWCGSSEWESQLRCRPRHLTVVQTYESVTKSPRVAEQCDVNIYSLAILNHGQVTKTTPELAPLLRTSTSHQWEDVESRQF